MSQIEALVCGGGGGDTKVACETHIEAPPLPPPDDHDLLPESMVVRVGSGRDLFWAEVGGGAVYERDDSTKGSTNPKAQAQQQHAKPNSKPRSNSQRSSGGLQAKPPIIGIPGKIQHHSGSLGRSVRRPANGRIFPKKLPRPGGGGGGGRKSAVPDEDPGSPKVSCIGKVLSERERDRCRRQRRLSPSEEEKVGRVEFSGCWASLSAMICFGDGERQTGSVTGQTTKGDSLAKTAAERRTTAEPAMEPPGLGAMRRFASVRRPEPLDREAAECGRRRSVGSLDDAQLERLADGSASVCL
ncbi:hypothetical protein MUK42_06190 [Musa troglodytarum]|uniref:Uncharacterized protein n=1 Tax=Musa troglodytarum TaxID=320322 RepID=A0A9E7HDD3_9LILI|nr:hypothetical protein MUK42_06190 [Musa troglodytarum]